MHVVLQLFASLYTKKIATIICQCYVCLVEELSVSHSFYLRVKNKCSDRSSHML
jgi:hypothetical protein